MMNQARIHWFCWHPRWNILGPLLTALALAGGLYIVASRLNLGETQALFWLEAALFFAIPGTYAWLIAKITPETWGLTERNWPQSLGVGLILGLLLGAAQIYYGMMGRQYLEIPPLSMPTFTLALALSMAAVGEEMLFRAWFQHTWEPAFGLIPAITIPSLAYAGLFAAFALTDLDPLPAPYLPAGYVPGLHFSVNLALVFSVAFVFNIVYRLIGSLWASIGANFLGRLAILFVWPYQQLFHVSPFLMLTVISILWAFVLLFLFRWHQAFKPAVKPVPPRVVHIIQPSPHKPSGGTYKGKGDQKTSFNKGRE